MDRKMVLLRDKIKSWLFEELENLFLFIMEIKDI
jgi:hypothetical protein